LSYSFPGAYKFIKESKVLTLPHHTYLKGFLGILRDKWIKAIHRDTYTVTKNSFVCVEHFEDKFVMRENVFPVVGGEPIIVPRIKPKLR